MRTKMSDENSIAHLLVALQLPAQFWVIHATAHGRKGKASGDKDFAIELKSWRQNVTKSKQRNDI